MNGKNSPQVFFLITLICTISLFSCAPKAPQGSLELINAYGQSKVSKQSVEAFQYLPESLDIKLSPTIIYTH